MNEERSLNTRVLVADDDPISRRILTSFLTKWNYDVTAVADGTSALQVLDREDTPRLAVLDWMMPGMEGVQICRLIRERADRPYIYVLLLTARTEKQDLLEGLKLGADDYLTKPFDAQELQARLHVGERILDLQDRLIAAKEELRFRATHDALTGIPNRGAVLDAIKREHSRQVRESSSFGVIMADLDHFKSVNDTYGHLCGDAVLKEAARRITACTRPYDIVGRYGGEEFLIVVAHADASITLALAERMRKAIQSEPIITDAGEISATASFGAVVSANASTTDPKMLVQLADEALYRAKRLGRDRSEMARSPSLEKTEIPSDASTP
jgi:two-component system cell cycle response regulator